MPNYTYRVLWDVGRGEYVALCLEFPREEQWGATAHEALTAMEQAVEVQLTEREEFGLEPRSPCPTMGTAARSSSEPLPCCTGG